MQRSKRSSTTLRGAYRSLQYQAGASFTTAHWLPLLRRSSTLVLQAESRSEEHTSELQSQSNLVCRLLLEKKKEVMHQPRSVRSSLPALRTRPLCDVRLGVLEDPRSPCQQTARPATVAVQRPSVACGRLHL